MISVKAPGKLYIAGEYAVVEKGMPSIIVALDQFITVNINHSKNLGEVHSKQYPDKIVHWEVVNNDIVFNNDEKDFDYVVSAIEVTTEYIKSLGYNLENFLINIDSCLNSSDDRKYGLGSSAAVTVGVVKAICDFYHLNLDLSDIFKLSSIAHLKVQGNGSLGDIAASVYGGWITYSSFDKEWLFKNLRLPINKIIDMDWPGLNIEPLTPPDNLKLLIGWTGSPASTSDLVKNVEKSENNNEYNNFLKDSRNCIQRMVHGFHTRSLKLIQKEILVNRLLLSKLGKFTGTNIETPKLSKLCDIAINNHGAAKSSGAGGGDCGIVIIDKNESTDKIINEWKENDIKNLKLNIHNKI
ncbi:phosphomevalonate kinase [Apilactobacillus apisilvae]|uniref:phosphomevalonate kinase n=1 Tax=Apilactobacillus apisilvae TaxID=2923364 RepID=A0ABY4PIS2_9LACO|nr:phosphomevalonate kinase [Apilactobacillus apisilvae]UQS85356.1 phosphomevalonate kinase [Apilactobacillus apisilvae]